MTFRAGKHRIHDLWAIVLIVAIAAAIPRFYLMLTAQYNFVVLIFIAFAVLPFLLLGKEGRTAIGFTRCSVRDSFLSFVVGVAASVLVYLTGYLFFKNSDFNWYVWIMHTFDKDNIIEQIRPSPLLFLAFSLPVMIFSPVGEEFFFRGMLHESFASKISPEVAMIADASFFGLTHLAHYGLVNGGGNIQVLPSALLWILLMAGVSVLFYQVKRRSGSIWGAVSCHSGFNFAMMAIIFYVIN